MAWVNALMYRSQHDTNKCSKLITCLYCALSSVETFARIIYIYILNKMKQVKDYKQAKSGWIVKTQDCFFKFISNASWAQVQYQTRVYVQFFFF